MVSIAQRVRDHVIANGITQARDAGLREVTMLARDVATALGLKHLTRDICQAMYGQKLARAANVRIERIGAAESLETQFRYIGKLYMI